MLDTKLRNAEYNMDTLHAWYLGQAQSLRLYGYLIIMVFYLIWGAHAFSHGLIHQGIIKTLTSAMLLSFVHAVATRDPNVTAYEMTPIIVALTVTVVTFLFRILRPRRNL